MASSRCSWQGIPPARVVCEFCAPEDVTIRQAGVGPHGSIPKESAADVPLLPWWVVRRINPLFKRLDDHSEHWVAHGRDYERCQLRASPTPGGWCQVVSPVCVKQPTSAPPDAGEPSRGKSLTVCFPMSQTI